MKIIFPFNNYPNFLVLAFSMVASRHYSGLEKWTDFCVGNINFGGSSTVRFNKNGVVQMGEEQVYKM